MKYVQAAPFINVMNNEVLRIENSTPEQVLSQEKLFKEARVCDVLALVCGAYIPMQGQVLTIQEVRKFHAIMDMVEGTYTPDYWMVFSDEEMLILIKIVSWTLPRMSPVLLRNADHLLEILETAPSKDPALEEEKVANAQR